MARKEATSNTKYPDAIVWNEKGKLNTGDKIEGYYLESITFDSKFGPFTMFIVKSIDGQIYKISGQSDIKKKFANIPEGVHVWIEYVGLTETEHGAKKTYKIEYDDEDVFAE